MASRVSLTEPIWFTLIRIEFPTCSSIPRFKRSVLVTNKSSPTSWILSPSSSVSARQPCQSSSAKPSSMETIGYCRTQSDQKRTMSWEDFDDWSDFLKTYLALSLSKNSLAAGSSAMAMSPPASKPACCMASRMSSMASTLALSDGAKPPSSPTAVLYPRFFNTDLSVWNTSAPHCNASENVYAPTVIAIAQLYGCVLACGCAARHRRATDGAVA